jgi:hypothetical protein
VGESGARPYLWPPGSLSLAGTTPSRRATVTAWYLTLKPNGWEIGKRDPAYPGGQRFLVSDKLPIYYFNTWYDIRIVQVGDTMAVWVNGQPLTRFTDSQSPYSEGQVGLYAGDAYAQFADVRVEPAALPALNGPAQRGGPTSAGP